MASILEEINNRNNELYMKAKIELSDLKKPITEIPRNNQKKEIIYNGMVKEGKEYMACYIFKNCW